MLVCYENWISTPKTRKLHFWRRSLRVHRRCLMNILFHYNGVFLHYFKNDDAISEATIKYTFDCLNKMFQLLYYLYLILVCTSPFDISTECCIIFNMTLFQYWLEILHKELCYYIYPYYIYNIHNRYPYCKYNYVYLINLLIFSSIKNILIINYYLQLQLAVSVAYYIYETEVVIWVNSTSAAIS